MRKWGGVLLCDAVGLGKTHVGLALVQECRQQGEAAVVVFPSVLRAHWTSKLNGLATVLTHAQLSRGGYSEALVGGTGLLLVDEAHAFRSPASRRYAALARLAASRRICLMTATPVNNSIWDLYFLIRLWATNSAFAGMGVTDLEGMFRELHVAAAAPPAFQCLLREIVVRRTRADIRMDDGRETSKRHMRFRFPVLAPPVAVDYDADAGAAGSHAAILHAIDPLDLGAVSPTASGLLRYLLLKRLASSPAALGATIRRLRRYHREFLAAAAEGLLLRPAEMRADGAIGDIEQLALRRLTLGPVPPGLDIGVLERRARDDLARLDSVRLQLARQDSRQDDKALQLSSLLTATLAGRKVLVFTEFRETALYLWRMLRRQGGVALIHGAGAYLGEKRAGRGTVIERFAPTANAARRHHPREHVRVLIATDVLAEGLNLQDCAHVISYDLPWNPVRLIQRVGRIDRMGSPHETVFAYNFVPDTYLEQYLEIMRRLRIKFHAIGLSLGLDRPVLADPLVQHDVPQLNPIVNAPEAASRDESLRAWLREQPDRAHSAWCAADANILTCRIDHGAGIGPGNRIGLVLEAVPGGRLTAFVGHGRRFREVDPAVIAELCIAQAACDGAARGDNECNGTGRATVLEVAEAASAVPRALRAIGRLSRVAADCGAVSGAVPVHCRRPHPAARIARRIHVAFAAIPGGADDQQSTTAERLLDALAQPLTIAAEQALGTLAGPGTASRPDDFDTLARSISRALALTPPGTQTAPNRIASVRLRGVVLLRPRG
jgi:superfamily II DNA or RNA helicase